MTQKELKHLSRGDLLEILLELSRENDHIRAENAQLRKQLEDRTIAIQNSGSLAEAALSLNGIFQAAQSACDQYAQNLRCRCADIEQYCQQLERQTQEKCDKMIAQAQAQAQTYLEEARKKVLDQEKTYAWLAEIIDGGEQIGA